MIARRTGQEKKRRLAGSKVEGMAPRHAVVLLPGIVLPAEPAYAALLQVLGERVEAVAKELEIYGSDQPPPGYGLDVEAQGVLREADARGFRRFHLVGYSAGGAASLAFMSVHGDRLLSLTLLEPAWAGTERTPQEEAVMQGIHALERLPPDQRMAGFQRLQLAAGVEPPQPPDGPPPAWMAKRPAGIAAILDAFDQAELDADVLRAFVPPSISHSAAAATRTTLAVWQSGWRRCSRTSRSRSSRSATTSTRRTASSPSAWPTRCSDSGNGPSRRRVG